MFHFPPFIYTRETKHQQQNIMKAVIYKKLLDRSYIREGNDIIVYSFLLAKSFMKLDCIWDNGSDFSINMESLEDLFCGEEKGFVLCYNINLDSIAYETGLNRRTVKNVIARLGNLGYIKDIEHITNIWLDINVVKGGFFEYTPKGLIGNLAIIYQILFDKGLPYNNTINTWRKTLAEQMGITVSTLDYYLTTLKHKNYIRRDDESGKIRFLK